MSERQPVLHPKVPPMHLKKKGLALLIDRPSLRPFDRKPERVKITLAMQPFETKRG
jgi:hypothetical protein